MKSRISISSVFLALWLLALLFLASGDAFPASSIDGLASPYLFNLPRCEILNLWSELRSRIPRFGYNAYPTGQSDFGLVEEYFRLRKEIEALQSRREQIGASTSGETEEVRQIEAKLHSIRQEREDMEARVKSILTRQLGQAFNEEGISVLPPIVFSFSTMPQILVISPRERIDLEKTVLLEPGLSLEKATELERRIEELSPPQGQKWGVSALVEGLGGLALYPSLIPEIVSLEQAIPTIAHEWVHQYLFFHPLGWKYGASYQMTTINETVADIVGDEIGDRVLIAYGIYLERGVKKKPEGFDFNSEMRQTRLKVDEFMEKGQVPEAESYMEERRLFLAKEGYYLRRLNQAYFAFHGSYADAPASTSPVQGWLKAIRNRSASLGQFLHTVAQISSYEELEKLALQ